jgi:hypothetical protein
MTYADLAKALGMAESIKRMLAKGDMRCHQSMPP